MHEIKGKCRHQTRLRLRLRLTIFAREENTESILTKITFSMYMVMYRCFYNVNFDKGKQKREREREAQRERILGRGARVRIIPPYELYGESIDRERERERRRSSPNTRFLN